MVTRNFKKNPGGSGSGQGFRHRGLKADFFKTGIPSILRAHTASYCFVNRMLVLSFLNSQTFAYLTEKLRLGGGSSLPQVTQSIEWYLGVRDPTRLSSSPLP